MILSNCACDLKCVATTTIEYFHSNDDYRLKRWGMDSYVYAPKDDYKHRAYWREMYTVEEADHLTGLFLLYTSIVYISTEVI